LKGVKFSGKEVEVPIPREVLMEIKDVAEATRKRIIPEVSKIQTLRANSGRIITPVIL